MVVQKPIIANLGYPKCLLLLLKFSISTANLKLQYESNWRQTCRTQSIYRKLTLILGKLNPAFKDWAKKLLRIYL